MIKSNVGTPTPMLPANDAVPGQKQECNIIDILHIKLNFKQIKQLTCY